MAAPTPSKVRSVSIYASSAPAGSRLDLRNISQSDLVWPSKHPLQTDWWWVDATSWCKDVNDILLAPPGKLITPTDNNLTVLSTVVSSDGLHAGFYLQGGAAGTMYKVTVKLVGANTGAYWAGDISLKCYSTINASLPGTGVGTMNGSILTFGGNTVVPG